MMWLVVGEMFLAYFRLVVIICELHNLQAFFPAQVAVLSNKDLI